MVAYKEIGENYYNQWSEKYKKVKSNTNHTEEEINEIIKYMNNRTFCGEYCGNQYHEHLIRHTKHTIYFYSIVK